MILVTFLVTRKMINRKNISFSQRIRIEAGRFTRVGTRLSAREHLHACVKWDLVDRDFFIFSNFVRQYFRFRSVNFFQIFGDN